MLEDSLSASTPVVTESGGRQIFAGLRVLDLSRWVSGEFCTKHFGDFGADVIKVEKPGEGSLTRRLGPFPDDVPDREKSALFLHLNINKRSISLDFSSATGRELLLRIAAKADLIVESFRPGTLERHDLGPEVLHTLNPRVVITRISAFGQTGRYRDYEATGLVLQAMGGPMNATGAADRPPHRKPGFLEHYTIGRMAAEASLAGLFAVRKSGRGAVVDVSGMEVLLAGADRRAPYLLTAAYAGVNAPRGVRSPHRGGSTFAGAFQCRNGYVVIYVTNPEFWSRFVDLVGEDNQEFRSTYRTRFDFDSAEEASKFEETARTWFARHSKFEVMQRAQAARIPLTAVFDIGEVFENPHFRERGFFVRAEHPMAGALEYLGPPWRMRGGWQLRHTAPLLGADTMPILEELGLDLNAAQSLRGEGVI